MTCTILTPEVVHIRIDIWTLHLLVRSEEFNSYFSSLFGPSPHFMYVRIRTRQAENQIVQKTVVCL
jgi:hypothetical protein